ncbi:DUF4865 family protein [Stenotrophomonas rhizophila]|uniref:DUF4865 family protein n=1 Tax=Stenotrophomonas rhizophila TaxID=216778 RepID=UPI001E3B3F8A|nr:DUF4865 family protein [Stenotrophomonas rhizophila]
MQYSLALADDHAMARIDRRIADKGPQFDGYPQLHMKAWLTARRQPELQGSVNLYAPFYLWASPQGQTDFLASPAFATLCRDLGRPAVQTWLPWHTELAPGLAQARHASRSITAIAADADLAALRAQAAVEARAAMARGALAVVTGFDPAGWTQLRVQLWKQAPAVQDPAAQVYAVGHVSLPTA